MSLLRPNLVRGDRLGAYVLEEPIARGGMAVVWRAKHARSGMVTAVKTLSPELASDPLFEAMLREESRIAARIDHPNVARVLGWGEERGIPYLATEWVDGVSAHALHRAVVKAVGRPMPAEVALRIAIDTCAGLHAAFADRYLGEPERLQGQVRCAVLLPEGHDLRLHDGGA